MCCKHIHEYHNGSAEPLPGEEKEHARPRINDCCAKFCITECFPCCFYLSFRIIFGKLSRQDEMWRDVSNKNIISTRAAWIITLSLAAPLFSVSSHISFILVAWLTDTAKASSVAPIIHIVLFFMFRQCYTINKGRFDASHNHWFPTFCLPFYPVYHFLCYINELCPVYFLYCCSFCKKNRRLRNIHTLFNTTTGYHKYEDSPKQPGLSGEANTDDSTLEDYFDTKAFCVTLSWGLILAIPIVCIVGVFHALPIISVSLVSELVGTIQIFFIVISVLVTYKVFSLKESDISRFLRKLRVTIMKSASSLDDIQKRENFDDVEAAAILVGELVKSDFGEISKQGREKRLRQLQGCI